MTHYVKIKVYYYFRLTVLTQKNAQQDAVHEKHKTLSCRDAIENPQMCVNTEPVFLPK